MITIVIAPSRTTQYANFEPDLEVRLIKLVHRFYCSWGCISSPYITIYGTDCTFGAHSTGGDGIHWFEC